MLSFANIPVGGCIVAHPDEELWRSMHGYERGMSIDGRRSNGLRISCRARAETVLQKSNDRARAAVGCNAVLCVPFRVAVPTHLKFYNSFLASRCYNEYINLSSTRLNLLKSVQHITKSSI